MTGVLAVGCALVGLVVGAGLAVVIERVPERRSVWVSPFPEVRAALRTRAGWMVVLLTGALSGAMALRFGASWVLPGYLLLSGALVALSVIDLRVQLLPNRIISPLTLVSLGLFGLAAVLEPDGDAFLRSLACGFGAFIVFFALHVISPRSMGFGDVKLSFVLGLYLGWLGVGETILGLFLGFVYGAVIGLALLVTKLRSRRDHIPFGPFLAAGAITAVLVGNVIVEWYRA